MRIRQGGLRYGIARQEKISRSGDEIPRLVPEIWQAKERPVQQPVGAEYQRKKEDRPFGERSLWLAAHLHRLMDRTRREFRIKFDLAESLFVVGDILRKDGGERLRLLWA